MKKKNLVIIFLAGILISGCVTKTAVEKEMITQIKEDCNIDSQEQKIVDRTAAGVLNILPGIGNFYLAANSDESSQWVFGILNLLTWPVSILWGIPEAAIDAKTINEKNTASHYQYSKRGKEEIESCKSNL